MSADRRVGRLAGSFQGRSRTFIRQAPEVSRKNVISRRNRAGLVSTARHSVSIPAGRTGGFGQWTRGFRVLPLSGSDAITVALDGDRPRSSAGGSSELPTTH